MHWEVFALLALFFWLPTTSPAATEENKFLLDIRQLTFEGKRSGEGYFSPDGKALIFQSEREASNPFYQIYLLDFESGESHRVSTGMGKTTCSFFRPNTDEVLFSSTHQDPNTSALQKAEIDFRQSGKQRRYSWDYDEHMDIFVARRDGTGLNRLTDAPGYDAEASYSPDGTKIAFCSLRDAYPTNKLSAQDLRRLETDPAWFGEIYIMNVDGTGVKRLTQTSGYDGGPFFSPDGQRIIWRRFEESGAIADIYTMKLDGSDVRRMTDFKSMSWAPYYHPSGRYVIFTSNKLGFSNFELHIVDSAGEREPVRVTFTDGFDGLPVFSPDGRQLCWTSGRTADNRSQLFLATWNHEEALAVLQSAPRRNPAVSASGFSTEITTNDLHSIVRFLASDELEGRMTGTKGTELASQYISENLQRAGLKPVGTNSSLFQPFEFTSGVRANSSSNELKLVVDGQETAFSAEKDFRPLSFTSNGAVEGEVIFAGYGLYLPGKADAGYDSFAGLNLSNKIALILRYVPEGVSAQRRAELNRYAGLRYKAMQARERGARGVLFVTGPTSPNAGELAALNFDAGVSGSGIPALTVNSNVLEQLMRVAGKSIREIQAQLDTENPHAEGGFVIPKAHIILSASVEHVKKGDRNILAAIPPSSGTHEYVMVGAHYDHLGHGETGAMRRAGEEALIHPGADDNASGVAAILEMAASLSAEKLNNPGAFSRGIIFGFWAGEELGLIGSSWFAEHSPLPLTNITAYLNFDMVGRLRENKLTLQGVGSSSVWRKEIEKRNVMAGFALALQDDPYLPTDTSAIYPKNIPVLAFFTGSHDEYHRPADKPGTLNYDGLKRITSFARGVAVDLARAPERPDYVTVKQSDAGGGSRENLRAYLGSIPDYATEAAGVKLSGVRGGSPAEAGGLKSGDVIIEFAGQKIANIYDYTYALDAAKIGQPVQIKVKRGEEIVNLSVTPQVRK